MLFPEINHFIFKGEALAHVKYDNLNFNIPSFLFLDKNINIIYSILYDKNLFLKFFTYDNMVICSNYIRTGYLDGKIREYLDELGGFKKTPVNNKILNKLSKKEEQIFCSICQDNKNNRCILKCNHPVCYDCMYNYLSNYSNKCPICREVISDETIDNDYTQNERLLGYFIYTYCHRCNICKYHININKRINEFINSGGLRNLEN